MCPIIIMLMVVLFTHSDVAMLLRDPYALDVLCKTILQCLLQIYEQNKLPRVSCEYTSVNKKIISDILRRRIVSLSFW